MGRAGKTAFAEKCGIKPTTMLGYLKGSSQPNLENLIKIASSCNVTVGWLANGEEPMQPLPHREKGEVVEVNELREEKGDQVRGAEGLQSAGDEKPRNPSIALFEEWLETQDLIYQAELYIDLREKFPKFDEWVKKRTSGDRRISSATEDNRRTA